MSNFHVALKKVVDDSYDVQIGCGLIDDCLLYTSPSPRDTR